VSRVLEGCKGVPQDNQLISYVEGDRCRPPRRKDGSRHIAQFDDLLLSIECRNEAASAHSCTLRFPFEGFGVELIFDRDRGGFYMTYYAMTDSTEALLQAKVATFSGMVGGAAFAANRFLQDEYGVDGTETPERYSGIYYLSQQVAVSGYEEIEASADPNEGDGTGKIRRSSSDRQ
jgi:hypothetical protein